MGIFDFFRGRQASPTTDTKASRIGPIVVGYNLGRPVWTQRPADQLAKEVYQRNVIAYACIWYTARAIASVPLAILNRPYGKEATPAKVPELAALLDRPNPVTDGASFMQTAASDLLLYGEAFLERIDIFSRPKELYRWSPSRTAPIPGPMGWAQAFKFKSANGQERTVEVDPTRADKCPILHLKEYNPIDETRGMSPAEAAAFSIDMHTGAAAWNKALVENSGRPSGALVYQPDERGEGLSEDQRIFMKEQIEQMFSGPSNAGRPLVLEGAFDWKALGLSPVDMDFANTKDSAARDIALAMGVPPMLLGIPGDNTYANYTEANKAFYRQSVLPILRQICSGLSWWLCPSFGQDLRIEPDIDDLPVFADERAALWNRIQTADFLLVNEKRAAVGLPPVPGGDVLLVPSSMIPIEAAGEMITGGPEPDSEDESESEPDPEE